MSVTEKLQFTVSLDHPVSVFDVSGLLSSVCFHNPQILGLLLQGEAYMRLVAIMGFLFTVCHIRTFERV